jgi:hypothetical protein
MADFFATSRSNYVLVKDVTAAIAALKDFDIPIHRHPKNANAIMLTGCDGDGTFSIVSYEELVETYLDLTEWASTHLVEGQVLVLVSAGAEKLRYISAWAEAYTWKGEVITVDLLDALFSKIYEKLDIDKIEVADPSYTCLYEGAST